MSNSFNRHSRLILNTIALLIWFLLLTLKWMGRPLTDAEIGYLFAVFGGSLIFAASVQSLTAVDDSPPVPRSLTALWGVVAFLAGLDRIVTPNGSSHIVSTLLLALCMAYQISIAASVRATGANSPLPEENDPLDTK